MNGINNMTNLKKSAKSNGVVLFAFNTKNVDYVKLADRSSRLIEKYLNLPITLVTDEDSNPKFNYDKIIRYNAQTGNVRYDLNFQLQEWKNFDRYSVYQLSPYDTTLLIDVDYFIFDRNLLKLFDQNFDFRLMYQMQTPERIDGGNMAPTSLPMVWATVMLFKKSKRSEMFFNLIGRIQRNYNYYRLLFGIRDTNFRNDFAFSMANIIINGYSLVPETSIPWKLMTIEHRLKEIYSKDNFFVVRTENRCDVVSRQSLHIMDKNYILSDQFGQLIDKVCHE